MGLRCIPVRLSEVRFSQDETEVLVAYSLGSCVGVALWDPEHRVGGMAHVFLPYPRQAANGEFPVSNQQGASSMLLCSSGEPGKYGETAVEYLVARLLGIGCKRANLVAAIAGGASVIKGLSPPFSNIGDLNSLVVEGALTKERIRITGKDTGGNHGRTVRLYIGSGRVTVSTMFHPEIELCLKE